MAEPTPILIAALSGRSLAAAARRAGYLPLVADIFGDADLRAIAGRWRRVAGDIASGLDRESLLAAAERLAPAGRRPLIGLVAGAGFEDRPRLLARLAQGRRLTGNPPEVLARIKDPAVFAARLARLGIPHPPVATSRPAIANDWLVRRAGASGGGHIRPANGETAPGPGHYYQKRAAGQPISALFLAADGRALSLGFSAQWRDGGSFRFGGLARPADLTRDIEAELTRAVEAVAADFGLVGLNSADFLLRARDFDLLEVNPRPGASLDAFDTGAGVGLFTLHCEACDGLLPRGWRPAAGATAIAVVTARRRSRVPRGFTWPDWSADRPAAGVSVEVGAPVCTVLAGAETAARARALVEARAGRILGALAPVERAPMLAAESRG